jgi:hypothetical protein
MTLKRLVVFALVVSCSSAAWSDDAKDEAKSMEGTWLASSAELAGEKFPDEVRKSIKMVLSDGKYTVTVG